MQKQAQSQTHDKSIKLLLLVLQPESLGCFVKVAANWCYSLFFILGELWGSVAISLLFW
jgi:ATP/ADP translocase